MAQQNATTLWNKYWSITNPTDTEAQSIMDPGDVLGWQQDSRIQSANEALDKAQEYAQSNSDANRDLYGQYLDRVNSEYGDTASKYSDYLKAIEDQEAYDAGSFDYDKSVEDFYSKSANQRIQQAMNNLRESSDIFSSDYQDAMAAKQQALASEEWDKAYDRYMQDRNQSLSEFSTNANLGQQAYENQYNKNSTLLSTSQNAKDNTINAYGNYINNMANQNNVDTTNYANYIQQQVANNNSQKSLLGRLFS